ncbi:Uncharacterised protein [Vibrio cincinnatiensis]|jgi:hypothetical protein|uniref:Uncharacterized protein n=1 Tax=Vibrio cincinnatiensis DSM 19608 TaxID=1123491 RepID=A0A1T4LKR1_VIBCI|nr:hypothetical protein SAMN02745782_00629 [Vibrio cincinnatiensis DSM 19608]SUP06045.1 Uncharacterised protein [Vibrio cincinnatiensis]
MFFSAKGILSLKLGMGVMYEGVGGFIESIEDDYLDDLGIIKWKLFNGNWGTK